MATTRAAELAKRRLTIASRRLGTTDPVQDLKGILDRSFDLPIGDARYGQNHLLPGKMPLEHSFSELASNALRLDMEPLGPGASPSARQQEVSREMRRLVHSHYGRPALRWFDEKSETFRGSRADGAARFGAWFGASYDEAGLQEAKAYYELAANGIEELPPNLQHASRVAMNALPGLVPIFMSVACGRQQGAQRVYFYYPDELKLLALEPLMNRLGIGHQLPALLTAVGLILGGRFTLPEGSVVIALRDTTKGIEMKLEIVLPAVPDPPRQMHGLIQMHLAQRPEAQRALQHWIQAMTPDEYSSPGDISVVSVRVSPTTSGRLSLYFVPVGYDQQAPSRPRRAAPTDPYAVYA